MPSPRPASSRQARAGLEYALGGVARANPLVAMWRWRYELAVLAGLAAIWLALDTATAAWLTAGLAVVLAGIACFPAGRRFLLARIWCIVTAHRVRAGCAQAWIHSRYGKLPIIVLTRRQPFGERVYLWCRAGISAADFVPPASCWPRPAGRRTSRSVATPATPTWSRSMSSAASPRPSGAATPGTTPAHPADRWPFQHRGNQPMTPTGSASHPPVRNRRAGCAGKPVLSRCGCDG